MLEFPLSLNEVKQITELGGGSFRRIKYINLVLGPLSKSQGRIEHHKEILFTENQINYQPPPPV